ncbi:MAG: hypothetical protein A2636_00400 [Elusimicrobia bacterium RIFCSPHIGHO2_01_FULL_64_10]|nr:MAG: hypothetical protein A2636_00400 [Elusimicrobia bacterium RIFCSPHIGHO2_01_FULL_64_10]
MTTDTYAFGIISSVTGISMGCAALVTGITDREMISSRSTVTSAVTPDPWYGDCARRVAVSPTAYAGAFAVTVMRLLLLCGQLIYVSDQAYTDASAAAPRPPSSRAWASRRNCPPEGMRTAVVALPSAPVRTEKLSAFRSVGSLSK